MVREGACVENRRAIPKPWKNPRASHVATGALGKVAVGRVAHERLFLSDETLGYHVVDLVAITERVGGEHG